MSESPSLPPTLSEVYPALTRVWAESSDAEAGQRLAREAVESVSTRFNAVDPICDYPAFCLSLETLWDTVDFGDLGGSSVNFAAARAIHESWRRGIAALSEELAPNQALQVRVQAMVQGARIEHRAWDPERAMTWIFGAMRQLLMEVGGMKALREIIAQPEPTLAGELYCELLAIWLPVARVTERHGWPYDPFHAAGTLDRLISDGLVLVGDRDRELPPYPRIHALVSQLFFAICERGERRDADIVEGLYGKDGWSRPVNARGQATRPLVDMTRARFYGDLADEMRYANVAVTSLRAARLHRHMRVLNQLNRWRLRPVA
jgi:hypothetical protein